MGDYGRVYFIVDCRVLRNRHEILSKMAKGECVENDLKELDNLEAEIFVEQIKLDLDNEQ